MAEQGCFAAQTKPSIVEGAGAQSVLAPGREQSDPEPELPQKQNAATTSLT